MKYRISVERRFQMGAVKNYKQMLKGNPSMVSKRFKEALQELKESVEERRKK